MGKIFLTAYPMKLVICFDVDGCEKYPGLNYEYFQTI